MTPEEKLKTQILSNKWYILLKYVSMIGLPAVATFVATFAQIWGMAGGDKVALTITAFNVLLGALVALSTVQYNRSDAKYDGVAHTVTDPGGLRGVTLEVNGDLERMPEKRDLTLKIQNTFVE